jgi:hypothetical protein
MGRHWQVAYIKGMHSPAHLSVFVHKAVSLRLSPTVPYLYSS